MRAGEQVTSGNFTFTATSIDGVIIVDVRSFDDDRGFFMETYKKPDFEAAGINADFVQHNQSASTKGVLRGLHYQINHPQSKLVRVIQGEVFDVAVDLRRDSPTFGKYEGVHLSANNHRQLFIPRGFAHGFLVLSDYAHFCYNCDDVYHPGDEGGLIWNDPDIGIIWPEIDGIPIAQERLTISEKDLEQPSFRELFGIPPFK